MGELKPKGHVDPSIDEVTRQHVGAGKVRETPKIQEPYENQRVWRSLPRTEVASQANPVIMPVLTEEDLLRIAEQSAEAARPLDEIEYPGFVHNNGYDVDKSGPSLLSDREVRLTLTNETPSPDTKDPLPEITPPLSSAGESPSEKSQKFDLTPSKSTKTHKSKGLRDTVRDLTILGLASWVMMVVGTHLGTNFGKNELFPGSTVVTALLLMVGGWAIYERGQSPLYPKKERYSMGALGGSVFITGIIALVSSGFFSNPWFLTVLMYFD